MCPHFRHPDGKSCSALESGLAGDFWPSTVRGGNSSLVEGRRRRRRVVTGEGSRSFCSSIVLAATHRKKRFVYPKLIPSPLVHKDSPPPTLVPLPRPLPRTLKRALEKGCAADGESATFSKSQVGLLMPLPMEIWRMLAGADTCEADFPRCDFNTAKSLPPTRCFCPFLLCRCSAHRPSATTKNALPGSHPLQRAN